jgi:putative phosphoesterase
MRIAVLSDIHGNLSAFEAVLADIHQMAPDLVLHGGDLADGGSSPVEIVDRIRELGWQGVMGNGDEMLSRPDTLESFASRSSVPSTLWAAVRQMAAETRSMLGDERLSWLGNQPSAITRPGFAIVHAAPQSCWEAPPATATDSELERTYSSLGQPVVAFGHTHCPAIRDIKGNPKLLINTGNVGLPFDGDPRACYLLLDGNKPTLRRVEYNIEKELRALSSCGLPGAAWTARMLLARSPQLP